MAKLSGRQLINTLLLSAAAVAVPVRATAQETISNARTTPVLTSTSGNTTIASGGSVTTTDGASVTIDSDNTVSNEGTIATGEANGATGVLVTGSRTFTYTQNGRINVLDDATTTDETPPNFADDRFGFRIAAGAYTGNVTFGATSFVDIDGDNSTAVAVEGDLTGNISLGGGIEVDGNNANAVLLTGTLTGNLIQGATSNINVQGVNADGIRIDGDINGAVVLGGNLAVTGFQDLIPDVASTTATGNDNNNASQRGLTSGDGLVVTRNVTGGVLIDGLLPSRFTPPSDAATRNAQIIVRGAGHAVRVDGGAGTPLTLGLVDTTDITGYGEFGFISRGAIVAQGLYEGVASEAVLFANAIINGGVRNDGTIDTASTDATSQAIRFGSGAQTPRFQNDGRVSASSIGTGASTVAIGIDAGASVGQIINNNRIETLAISDTGDAVAIRDLSGTVTQVTNAGTISAVLRDDNDNDAATTDDAGTPIGRAFAYDFAANTTGISIFNTVQSNFAGTAAQRQAFGNVTGDVRTGSGNDSYGADAGTTVGNISLGAGDDQVSLSTDAIIVGTVDFGTGADSAALDNGNLIGDLVFGGSGVVTLTNESFFRGAVSAADTLDVSVTGSDFLLTGTTPTTIRNLTVGANSVLGFSVAADGSAVSRINADLVTLADGTEIRTLFAGAFAQNLEAVIISAGALTGNIDQLVLNATGSSPVLFEQTLAVSDENPNDIVLSLRRRSADELGISKNLQPAYDPIVVALTDDAELGAALFNVATQEEFLDAFSQTIAGPLDAPLAYARAQNNSVTSIISQRVDQLGRDEALPRTAWLQEETYFVNRSEDADSNGFEGGGFVIAAGADTPVGPVDVVGASVHFGSSRYDEQLGNDFPFNRLTYGIDFYAADSIGAVEIDGRVGVARSTSDSERTVRIGDVERQTEGEWDGTQVTANGRIRYRQSVGPVDFTPFASIDYVSLTEDAYTETGDETLALTVADREAESLRANVGVALSRDFDVAPSAYDTSIPGTFTPRLTLGWSQELITDDIVATYNFEGGTPFSLTSEPEKSAGIVGADLAYQNQYAKVHVGASGQFGETTNVFMLRVGIGLKW